MAKFRSATAKLWTAAELQLHTAEQQLPALEVAKLKAFFPAGIERGSLVEITGHKSSGRTSASLYVLAESISKQEVCACVDLHNQFDPEALLQCGVSLDQLCWVRCRGSVEHAIRSTDLLLHAGGFGVVMLDLCGASPKSLNKIPLSYWFRFRRAIEETPTILLVCSEQPQARSCSSGSLELQTSRFHWDGVLPYSLLKCLESTVRPQRATKAKVTSIRPESLLIQTPVTNY